MVRYVSHSSVTTKKTINYMLKHYGKSYPLSVYLHYANSYKIHIRVISVGVVMRHIYSQKRVLADWIEEVDGL